MHDPSLKASHPLLPSWLFSKPSPLPLPTLLTLEEAYHANHISYSLYCRWMEATFPEYALGEYPSLLSLWDDRLPHLLSLTRETQSDLLRTSLRASQLPSNVLSGVVGYLCPHFSIYWCRSHHVLHAKLRPGNISSRRQLKPLNLLFPWYEHEDKQKTNVDLASLVFQALHRKAVSINDLNTLFQLFPVGTRNVTLTAHLLAMLGLPSWQKVKSLMLADKACCLTHQAYQKYFKAVTTAVRRLARWRDGSHLPLQDIASLAYFELSSGRACNTSSWSEEKAKRVGPVLPLKDPWTGLNLSIFLRPVLREALDKLVSHVPLYPDWAAFITQRQRWATSGSASGQFLEIEGEKVRINKRSYFETLTASEMAAWLDTTPEIRAVASEKMEPGKSRAIYGTTPIEQTIASFVVGPIEKVMPRLPGIEFGLKGSAEVASIARRLEHARGDRIECTMIDYADFNYQHTLEAMNILFEELSSALSAKFPGHDVVRAASWLAQAQLNQYVRFPHDPKYYKVTQGMFSGTRTTNFTNTLLNWAYYETMKRRLEHCTGLTPVDEFRIHQGDDVWISNRSRVWAAALYTSMSEAGFVFQSSKQMFDVSRGEFLRVMYTREGALGYAARAIASFIIKPVQSVSELAPQARATALNSSIHLLFRRGLSSKACEVLWWATIPHALRLSLPSRAGVGVPLWVAGQSSAAGGLDLGPPETVGVELHRTPPLPQIDVSSKFLAQHIPSHMAHDWIVHMSHSVRQFDAKSLEAALHRLNVTDSLRLTDRRLSMRRHEKDLKRWVSFLPSNRHFKDTRIPLTTWLAIEDPETAHHPGVVSDLVTVMYRRMRYYLHEMVDVTPQALLQKAISASPFSDLSSAQVALKVGALDAAHACCSTAVNRSVASRAMRWLDSIQLMLGREVASRWVSGSSGIGPSLESRLHPITLSWLSSVAGHWAVLNAVVRGIRKATHWDCFLERWTKSVIKAAITDPRLPALSHF